MNDQTRVPGSWLQQGPAQAAWSSGKYKQMSISFSLSPSLPLSPSHGTCWLLALRKEQSWNTQLKTPEASSCPSLPLPPHLTLILLVDSRSDFITVEELLSPGASRPEEPLSVSGGSSSFPALFLKCAHSSSLLGSSRHDASCSHENSFLFCLFQSVWPQIQASFCR